MNLTIVHQGDCAQDALRSDEARDYYSASDQSTDAGEEPADHPVALAVITLGHPADRRVVGELVEANLSLVEILVAERLRTVPHHVHRDDLMSAGMMALVLSAVAFDAGRGSGFRSFAAFRIRGALIDELRGMDWASRSVRSRAREVETVTRQLAMTLERSPGAGEIAAALGISVRELDAIHADLARGTVVSLQSFTPDVVSDVLPDQTHGPESLLLHREQLGYLHDAIDALPERLRGVVDAYYFQNRSMSDIAAELSVTQSRVSQMCSEATALIRDGMNSQLDPDALAPLARTGRAAATRDAYYQALAGRHSVAGRLAMSTCQGEMRARRFAVSSGAGATESRSRIA